MDDLFRLEVDQAVDHLLQVISGLNFGDGFALFQHVADALSISNKSTPLGQFSITM